MSTEKRAVRPWSFRTATNRGGNVCNTEGARRQTLWAGGAIPVGGVFNEVLIKDVGELQPEPGGEEPRQSGETLTGEARRAGRRPPAFSGCCAKRTGGGSAESSDGEFEESQESWLKLGFLALPKRFPLVPRTS